MSRCAHDAEPDVVDESMLAEVVAALQEFDRHAAWSRTCAIGALILDKFYSGDPGRWRVKSRAKHHSLRRLASQPHCPLKKSALADAINVFLFAKQHPEVRELENIAPGHVSRVLRLESHSATEWLQTASRERLSVKALASRLAGAAQKRRSTRGAEDTVRSLKRIQQKLTSVVEQLKQPEAWLYLDAEKIEALVVNTRHHLDVMFSAVEGAVQLHAPRSGGLRLLVPCRADSP